MSRHHYRIKNDPRWHQARRDCFERDGFACVRCDATAGLQCDHIIRISDDISLAFELSNLQTLCGDCHREKEKEYELKQQIRIEWVNPRYPELGFLIEEKESEEDSFIL